MFDICICLVSFNDSNLASCVRVALEAIADVRALLRPIKNKLFPPGQRMASTSDPGWRHGILICSKD